MRDINYKYIVLFLTIMLTVVVNTAIFANNSLWSDDSADIYQDRTDFTEGDVVTVIIEEAASAIQSADTDSSQATSTEAGGGGLLSFLGSFGFNYSDADNADGSTRRQGSFEANITTQIVEVLDNGNLKIEGSKKVIINEEEQIISLAGIIRPEDIDLDNRIESQKVADADIEYKGEGPIAHKQSPSLLNWLFGWIF